MRGMTMKRLSTIGLTLLALLYAAMPALAETRVLFSDLTYGDEAFQLHMNDRSAEVVFNGNTYVFTDNRAEYREAFMVYGGKTRSIYEQTIPASRYSAEGPESLLLGTLTISVEPDMVLYIARGNRYSGEYVVSDPISLADNYTEEIYLPRDAAGNPVIIDQIYLYSYTDLGETRYYALSLYIDYESYAASHGQPDLSGVPEALQPETDPVAAASEPEPADPAVLLVRNALFAAGKPFGDGMRAFHIDYSPLSALEQSVGLSGEMLNLPASGELFAFFDGSESVVIFVDGDGNAIRILDHQANLETGELLGLLTRDASGSPAWTPATENTVPLLAELQWIEKICAQSGLSVRSHASVNVWHELPAETIAAIR